MRNFFKVINNNGIISGIIVVIIVFIVGYFFSREKQIFTYETISNKILFDREDNNSFIILDKDSLRINSNIYYLEVDLWNQGNIAIEASDLKIPIELKIPKGYQFFENIVIEETHKKITQTKFSLNDSLNKLVINFLYLEKGNGIKIKGYYKSKYLEACSPEINGYITNQGLIKNYNTSFLNKNGWIIFGILLFALYFTVNLTSNDILDKINFQIKSWFKKDQKKGLNAITLLTIISFFFLMFGTYLFLKYSIEFFISYFNGKSPFNN